MTTVRHVVESPEEGLPGPPQDSLPPISTNCQIGTNGVWVNCHIGTNGIETTVILGQMELRQLSYWVNCRCANCRCSNCHIESTVVEPTVIEPTVIVPTVVASSFYISPPQSSSKIIIIFHERYANGCRFLARFFHNKINWSSYFALLDIKLQRPIRYPTKTG